MQRAAPEARFVLQWERCVQTFPPMRAGDCRFNTADRRAGAVPTRARGGSPFADRVVARWRKSLPCVRGIAEAAGVCLGC